MCHGNWCPATETVEKIRDTGGRAEASVADLSEENGASGLLGETISRTGAPELLVNNAGTIYRQAAEEHEIAMWHQVLPVNLNRLFKLCLLAACAMLERAAGSQEFWRYWPVTT